jgi:hypothetical protein
MLSVQVNGPLQRMIDDVGSVLMQNSLTVTEDANVPPDVHLTKLAPYILPWTSWGGVPGAGSSPAVELFLVRTTRESLVEWICCALMANILTL